MGDAAPHDPELTTGYTLAQVTRDAENADPVDISAVPLGDASDTLAAFTNIASENRGLLVQADSTNVAPVLSRAFDTITAPVSAPPPGPEDPVGLVGNWQGSVPASSQPVEFNVQSRTFDTLVATLVVGSTTLSGTFTGTATLDGHFQYSLVTQNGGAARLIGAVKNGVLTFSTLQIPGTGGVSLPNLKLERIGD